MPNIIVHGKYYKQTVLLLLKADQHAKKKIPTPWFQASFEWPPTSL